MKIVIIAATPAREIALERATRLGVGKNISVELRGKAYIRECHAELSDILRGNADREVENEPIEPTVIVMDHITRPMHRSVPETSDVSVPVVRATRGNAVIVVVDRRRCDYDADHAFGDAASPADLCIASEQLGAKRLWREREGPGTGVPSYCPELLRWAERRAAQIRVLARRPEQTALQILGLDEGPRGAGSELTLRQQAALAPDSRNLSTVRWTRTYETACQDLTLMQRRTIKRYGYRRNPWVAKASRQATLWATAAMLDRWVRLELLPIGKPIMGLRQLIRERPGIIDWDGEQSENSNHALRAGHEHKAIAEAVRTELAASRMDDWPWYPEAVFHRKKVEKQRWKGVSTSDTEEVLVHCGSTDRFERLQPGRQHYRIALASGDGTRGPSIVVKSARMWPACRVKKSR